MILVGKSFGALAISDYARTYPNEIVGVLLIDPLTEKAFDTSFRDYIEWKVRVCTFYAIGAFTGFNRLAMMLELFPPAQHISVLPDMQREVLEREWNRCIHTLLLQNSKTHIDLIFI